MILLPTLHGYQLLPKSGYEDIKHRPQQHLPGKFIALGFFRGNKGLEAFSIDIGLIGSSVKLILN